MIIVWLFTKFTSLFTSLFTGLFTKSHVRLFIITNRSPPNHFRVTMKAGFGVPITVVVLILVSKQTPYNVTMPVGSGENTKKNNNNIKKYQTYQTDKQTG